MKIALIPIDNRPVCYTLLQEIAAIDNDLELFLPERDFLGGLHSIANIDAIFDWMENFKDIDAMIISLDTIAYGGLITSRRSKDEFNVIKERLEKFKNNFKGKVYAFSSIMRISNNNINEEEKKYWDKFGKQIFEYSYNFHKEGLDKSDIPQDILNDYLATRYRNFQINKMYLQWLEEGILDTLVFSKDDCAEFGLNVLEAEILNKIIKEKNLSAFVKTGADEIPLTLFARVITELKCQNAQVPKISTKFLAPEDKNLISNYEDISIEKSVQSQIELSGCKLINEEGADIVLIVNNFEQNQGEIVMNIKTKPFSAKIELPQKPFIIADIRFANGADNKFVSQLFKKSLNFDNFYGYSAWNTSANSLGSLICAAIIRYLAQDFNEEEFRKLQMIRFLDDWAYQANVRQKLKKNPQAINSKTKEIKPDLKELKKFMFPFEKKLKKILHINPQIKYKFPWKRFFEIEITIKSLKNE
jgi:hypothetical protein